MPECGRALAACELCLRWATDLAGAIARAVRPRLISERDAMPRSDALGMVTTGIAVDMRRVAAHIADTRLRQRFELLYIQPLGAQQASLRFWPAHAIGSKMPIGAHDTMAGNEERRRVARHRRADRAHRAGAPDLAGDPAVGAHLAMRDFTRLQQRRAGERGQVAQVEGEGSAGIPRKPRLHRRGEP